MTLTVDKLTFGEEFRTYYSPKPGSPEILVIPEFQFVMVDGYGDPEIGTDLSSAIEALFTFMYTFKYSRKRANLHPDYTVGPIEGLWWSSAGHAHAMGLKKDWL